MTLDRTAATAAIPLLLAALLAPAVAGGPPPEPGPQAPPSEGKEIDDAALERLLALHHTEEEDVRLVMVPATVVDRKGRTVRGLDEKDFRLSENDVPQQIRYFSTEAREPISVAFLLDLSGSMAQLNKLLEAKEAIRFFVDALRPGDRFGLIGFADDQVTWITDFTSDKEKFLRRLNVQRAWGPTALYDAVAATPRLVDGDVVGRKAIVLITDGVDNASSINMYEAIQTARSVNVPIYTIGFTHLPERLLRSGETVRNLKVLKLFAEETGGAVFAVRDPDELKDAVADVETELRLQYLIGYYPTDRAWDGRFRRIELETPDRGNLQVRVRRGYYANP